MIIGLLAMVGWGASNFFSGRLSKSIGFLPALVSSTLGVIVCLFLIVRVGRLPMALPSGQPLILLSIAGLLLAIAGLAFFKGLEIGKVSLLSPIAASWPMGIAVIAIVSKQSPFSYITIVGMILVTLGVFVASLRQTRTVLRFSDPGIPYALIALVSWIGAFYFFGHTLSSVPWGTANITFLSVGFVFNIFFALWKRIPITWKLTSKNILYFLASSVPSAAAFYFYSLGMKSSEAGITAITTNANPLITVLLALVFLREHLNKKQLVGIAMVIGGLILTNY